MRVQNTGTAPVTEIVQVYHGRLPTSVETPPRLLGRARVTLAPGEARFVDIRVRPGTAEHQLAYWDEAADAWVTPTGRTAIYVGRSARDIQLTGNLTIQP